MIVLHRELELLKDFEKEDVALAEKLQAKRAEKVINIPRYVTTNSIIGRIYS